MQIFGHDLEITYDRDEVTVDAQAMLLIMGAVGDIHDVRGRLRLALSGLIASGEGAKTPYLGVLQSVKLTQNPMVLQQH